MLKQQGVRTFFTVVAVAFTVAIQPAIAKVGPENLKHCKDLAFSIEQ
jgi:hypothetical protein